MKRIFQPLHVLSCLVQATAHSGNDSQNAIGLIAALVVVFGTLATFVVPPQILLAGAIEIGFGTCFWGWQVVDKMADHEDPAVPGILRRHREQRDTRDGDVLGISSTHAINGVIVGVGATRGKDAVQWRVVREMMTAWIITIPLVFACAFAGYEILSGVLSLKG